MTRDELKMFGYQLWEGMVRALRGAGEVTAVRYYRVRDILWWVHKEPGFSTVCNVQIVPYVPGVLRIKALDCVCAHGLRVEQLFMGNGLAARGMRELSFAADELQNPGVVADIGEFFVRLIKGDRYVMPLFAHDAHFPGYAWTVAGARALEKRKAEVKARRSSFLPGTEGTR
jgi:hypothetical protein